MSRLMRFTVVVSLAIALTPVSSDLEAAIGDVTGAGTFGVMPDIISVNQFSGSASSAYPIFVPPGRSGVQPDIIVGYNSGSASNGFLGRGWDIAFPFIERSTRYGQPTFTWSDTFAIRWKGQFLDLIMICDPNSGCPEGTREFRTQIETFMRIKSYSLPPALTYWEVEDGTGRKYQLGKDGSLGPWNQVGDFKWALNRVDDSHGNYLTMDWMIDAGTLYPLLIMYTGNTTTGLAPTNQVEFSYEGRYDVSDSLLGTPTGEAKAELQYRLRRIRSWAGSQVASLYLFDYTTTSPGDHPVSMCGLGCAPTTVTCPNGRQSSCANTCDENTGFCSTCAPPACTLCTGISCCSGYTCNLTNGYCCANGSCVAPGSTCGGGSGGGGGGGGGGGPHQEMATPAGDGSYSPDQDGPSLLAAITRWDAGGTTHLPSTTFSYLTNTSKAWGTGGGGIQDIPALIMRRNCEPDHWPFEDFGAQVADVNGDGLPDLLRGRGRSLICGSEGVPIREVLINTNGQWALDPSYTLPIDFVINCLGADLDNGVRVMDVNGDGLDDLVQSIKTTDNPPAFGQTCNVLRSTVYLNSGHGWAEAPSGQFVVPIPFTYDPLKFCEDAGRDLGVRFGDVNGDGKIDIISRRDYQDQIQAEYVYLNNGQGWDLKDGWRVPLPMMAYEHSAYDPGARVLDINGDGLVDIVNSRSWNGGVLSDVFLGTGSADASGHVWVPTTDPEWVIPEPFTSIDNSATTTSWSDLGVRFGDVNGDGRVDIIRGYEAEQSCTSCSDTVEKKVYLHRAGKGWREDPEWGPHVPFTFVRHKDGSENYDEGVRLVDVDGNAAVDFVKAMDDCGSVAQVRMMSNETFTDLLMEINNGIGGSTTLTYVSSASYDNHQIGAPAGSPANLGSIIPVLSSSTQSDGQVGEGHQFTTTYSYKAGVVHYPRREFRGFGYVREDHPGGRSYTETLFVQDPSLAVAPLTGAVDRTVLRRTNDNSVFSLATNTYVRENRMGNDGPYTDWLQRSDGYLFDWSTSASIESLDLSAASHHTAKAISKTFSGLPNDFVVSQEIQELGDVATSSDDLYTQEYFINDSSSWRIGFPWKTTSSDAAGGGGATLTASWTYYDGLSLGSVGSKGEVSRSEKWPGTGSAVPGLGTNRVELASYDDYGHVIQKTDGEGHQSFVDYGIFDSTRTFADRTRSVTTGGGTSQNHLTDTLYDARLGVPLQVTQTGAGGSVFFRYDPFGRVTKTWTALDSESLPTTCYQYNLEVVPVTVLKFDREVSGTGEACGSTGMLGSASFFDGLGRRIEGKGETSEAGHSSRVLDAQVFDSEGRVSESKSPTFSTSSLVTYDVPMEDSPGTKVRYDKVGRPEYVTLPGIPTIVNSFQGWSVSQTDPEGHRTEVDLDAFGRQIQRRQFDDSQLVYSTNTLTYDRLGRLRQVTDSTGTNRWLYEYDALSELTSSTDPDTGTVSLEYFRDGTLKQFTDAAGLHLTFLYDELGRVLQETRPDTTLVTLRYDEPSGGTAAIGHLTSVEDSASAVRMEYGFDSIGRPQQSRQRVNGVWYDVAAALDSLGRVQVLTYPDNSVVYYQYGSDGRISAIPGFVTNIQYTAWGALRSMRYSNGITVNDEYDLVRQWLNKKTAFSQLVGSNVVDATYGRSSGGFVRSVVDAAGTASQVFDIDHQYRLKEATGSYGHLTYSFNSIGNMTSKRLNEEPPLTYAFGGAGPHQPVSASDGSLLAYDPYGNLKRSLRGGVGRYYDYDVDGRLTHILDTDSGIETSYTYAPDGSRVKRVESQPGAGSIVTTLVSDLYQEDPSGYKTFVYLDSLRIAEVRGASEKHFYIDDQVGSTSLVTSNEGAVEHRLEYKPYGEFSSAPSGNFSPEFGFAGSRRDPVSKLQDFGARIYDPLLGRFLTPDPLLGDPTDPNALNPYGYARWNPISLRDFGGLSVGSWEDEVAASNGYASYDVADSWAGMGEWSSGMFDSGGLFTDRGTLPSGPLPFLSLSPQGPLPLALVPSHKPVVLDEGGSSSGSAWDMSPGAVVESAAVQIVQDTLVGGTKGLANVGMGMTHLANTPVDALLSTFTTFRFGGRMSELQGSTPGEKGAMAGVFISSFFVGAGEARLATKSAESAERLVIGRGATLDMPGTLRPGEFRLKWDPRPTKKGEWKINSGLLRRAMRMMKPIRDANPGDTGGIFLNAERGLLRHFGWRFDPATSMWYPPM